MSERVGGGVQSENSERKKAEEKQREDKSWDKAKKD